MLKYESEIFFVIVLDKIFLSGNAFISAVA